MPDNPTLMAEAGVGVLTLFQISVVAWMWCIQRRISKIEARLDGR
jgi:hypothetical protein